MAVMSFHLGVFSLEFITLFSGIFAAESQVKLASQYSGTSVPGFLGSSVTFTWNFTGKVRIVTFGTKRKETVSMEDTLLRLTASGTEFFNVTLYNGRVSGKWIFKSPSQVNFTLSAIKEIDNRVFICSFQPQNILLNPVTDIVRLNVQGLPKAAFISRYKTIETGGNVMFACEVIGFPVPTVKWKRRAISSEIEIKDDNVKYEVNSHSGSSNLTIRSTTVEDHGFYICEASNFKSDRARAYLGVLSLYVDDDMCPKSIDATIGESRTICCPVKGHPPPDIFWQLPNGTSHYSDDITLSIVLRTDNDFGVYSCLARGLEKDIGQVVIIRKKVLQPIADPQNVTITLKPGDRFFWKPVPKALEYLLRISETYSTKAISLLGGNITSVEIPYSSLVFKRKNVDERPRMVKVTIEVEAIGESGISGRRVPHKVVIYASATTFTVSLMMLMFSFVLYNLQ